jgi:hypothetical protein
LEGPPGTGKSHTITAIAFNAILNNQNILILSDKKEALDVVEDKITETMNKMRIDKNFQNPILRLGKTGSTYSQILSNAVMNNIKLHHRAVKKEYEELESNIEKVSKTLIDQIDDEIARCGDIDLRDVFEMIALDREYNGQDETVDLAEVLNIPNSTDDLKEFRKIFRHLREILNGGETRELLKLLRLDPNKLKDLNGLFQASELAREISDIIRFLRERYSSRIDIINKFESFSDGDLKPLSSYIREYEKVSSFLAILFKRGKIQHLNNTFERTFVTSQ